MPIQRTGDDFGSRLRAAREAKGVSLREIANRTKISVGVLDALERNEIARLPGGIFTRAFVRAYAVEAGLDPNDVTDDFVRSFPDDSVTAGHLSTAASAAEYQAHESGQRMASTTFTLLLISLPVAAVLLYFGFSHREPAEAAARRAPQTSVTGPSASPDPRQSTAAGLKVEIVAVRPLDLSVTVDDRPPMDLQLSKGGSRTFEADRDLFLTFSDMTAFQWDINGLPGHGLGAGAETTVHLTPDNFRDYTSPR
jgi:transcriptional regulator with XRE-family HTH domain